MEKDTLIKVTLKQEGDEQVWNIQAKAGMTIGDAFLNLVGFLESLQKMAEKTPNTPFSGIDGAKKVE